MPRATQQLSITLTDEMAELVRAKVASGEYASESEVIGDGLHTSMLQNQAKEAWLKNDVAPAYDAIQANPERAVSPQQVREKLSAIRGAAKTSR